MQYIPRKYELPEGVLKAGRNTIVVRVVNCAGMGGFYKEKPYALVLGDQRLDLCGEWQYKIGAKKEPMPESSFVMWKPTGLYNAMIAPAINYSLRGVLWYQGETNAQNPENYEALLEALICDWRKKWEQGEFPFLYVQLPNFQEPRYSPAAGKWPFIREAQRKTLKLSCTGMAVTIDLGEWNDVHPTNKKDVGYRLALLAEKLAYQEDGITATGPLLESALRRENKIVLSFTEIGSGLITKDNKRPGTFLIAGEDQCYVAADAEISGNCVIVWQQEIVHPVYVRYAWADQPLEANLYNREGLPASPFQCRV
jgi:sialate O-acetylesterase